MKDLRVEMIHCPTDEDWLEVKRRAFVTVGKDTDVPPTMHWKERILIARHSPIRYLRFSFRLSVPYWVSVHLCRHVMAQPYVRSQRNDRQDKYDRNAARQDEPVDMIWDLNAEALITTLQKRLCMQAAPETRRVAEMMRDLVIEKLPEFEVVLMRPCEFNSGICHEFKTCGLWADGAEREGKGI